MVRSALRRSRVCPTLIFNLALGLALFSGASCSHAALIANSRDGNRPVPQSSPVRRGVPTCTIRSADDDARQLRRAREGWLAEPCDVQHRMVSSAEVPSRKPDLFRSTASGTAARWWSPQGNKGGQRCGQRLVANLLKHGVATSTAGPRCGVRARRGRGTVAA